MKTYPRLNNDQHHTIEEALKTIKSSTGKEERIYREIVLRELSKIKQSLIDHERYEAVAEIKKLEDSYELPIPLMQA